MYVQYMCRGDKAWSRSFIYRDGDSGCAGRCVGGNVQTQALCFRSQSVFFPLQLIALSQRCSPPPYLDMIDNGFVLTEREAHEKMIQRRIVNRRSKKVVIRPQTPSQQEFVVRCKKEASNMLLGVSLKSRGVMILSAPPGPCQERPTNSILLSAIPSKCIIQFREPGCRRDPLFRCDVTTCELQDRTIVTIVTNHHAAMKSILMLRAIPLLCPPVQPTFLPTEKGLQHTLILQGGTGYLSL